MKSPLCNSLKEISGQPIRLAIMLIASVFILIFSLLAPPGVGLFDKVGMELAIIAVALFLSHFPMGIFLSAHVFVVSAAAGSILRFYDLFPGYDRVVHFMSGIILGYVGFYIAKWMLRHLDMEQSPVILTASGFLFSCAGAGFWEIIEFTTDCITHMGVQHGNTDTMGDIVAGFIGAACFAAVRLYQYRREMGAFLRSALHMHKKDSGEPKPVLHSHTDSTKRHEN